MVVAQLGLHVAQGGAQAFFDDGVVEGHVEHLRHGQPLLVRPGEQVGDVFGGGAEHFGGCGLGF